MSFFKDASARSRARLSALIRTGKSRPLFLPAAGALIVIMLALVLYWAHSNPGTQPLCLLAAVLSAVLFTAVCIVFLWQWLTDWMLDGGDRLADGGAQTAGTREYLQVFFSLLVFQALVLFFIYLLRIALRGYSSFRDALSFWTCIDSQHYLAIAEDWYLSDAGIDRVVQLVFLPGYPLVIRLFHLIFRNYLYAGLCASSLCFAGAGTVLYRLALMDMDRETARRALRFACLMPGAFFYAAPMAESQFLLLSLSCILLIRKRQWLPACILGGMAAFTRSLGMMLVVPAGYELLTDTLRNGAPKGVGRRIGQFACLLLIPAGFGAYCLICKQVSGNPFQWTIYQREHWHQQLGLFFSTASYQTREVLGDWQDKDFETFFGLWLPNLLFSLAALGIMAAGGQKLRTSYSAYFLIYYAVAIGATWLLSAPRYLLVCFPIPFALAELTRDRRADGFVTVILTAVSVLYALLFAARWQVW